MTLLLLIPGGRGMDLLEAGGGALGGRGGGMGGGGGISIWLSCPGEDDKKRRSGAMEREELI